MATYTDVNKANWNERAALHAKSLDYDVARLQRDATALSDVVHFDLPLLGSIEGLDVAHLQCHIGTDTLSLARRGAKSVVGLDFSTASIAEARELATKAADCQALNLRFVEADINHAVEALGSASFDLVFTGIGALCWLPSIKQWAKQVSGLLRPGGRLFVREGHPMVWTIDESITDAPGFVVTYSYFETSKPVESVSDMTYVDTGNRRLENKTSFSWNHGIGEIITALLEAGMEITAFVEHRSIPWVAFPGKMEKAAEPGEWKITAGEDNVPLSYTLQAVRR
ncbi:Putative S-adenosyl-L-methionine-dependent methyltransferase, Methyltransferase domain 25 [Septoria linicola]|uniref:S-adenosyl-L-methionine-dependent methyltransferase, Methyltransferase domain 25 n=1 Tax=Septoria linicola TaxID=215465 RepID=A0A9Q9AHC1_9PEZI|nr:Putative S-adenosyl-L-methionine-dependent methyltransferase, Methyltransferase domain 25 [Septoria linicola]